MYHSSKYINMIRADFENFQQNLSLSNLLCFFAILVFPSLLNMFLNSNIENTGIVWSCSMQRRRTTRDWVVNSLPVWQKWTKTQSSWQIDIFLYQVENCGHRYCRFHDKTTQSCTIPSQFLMKLLDYEVTVGHFQDQIEF